MTTSLSFATLALSLLAVLGLLFVWWQQRSLNRLKRTFFAGKTGADLEDILQILAREIKSLKEEHVVLEQALVQMHTDSGLAVQKVGLVKFNPFEDGGGNFSFCLALLDGHNSGVVLTSMHGRQQNRIYTKRIWNGASETPLTEEEQEAILAAGSKSQINYKS